MESRIAEEISRYGIPVGKGSFERGQDISAVAVVRLDIKACIS